MSKKTTKRALWMSVLSLFLCFSMLVGTTFAWFTDEVESGLNQIVAGNLDVELYHTNTKDNNEKVTTETKLFDEVNPQLWEPGAVAFENLTVTNEGTLALKYQLSINFENATVVNGHSLAEALKVGVVEGGFEIDEDTTRAAVLAEVKTWQPMASFSLSGELAGKVEAEGKTTIDSAVYGIVIYWEPGDNEFDNLFNMNNENKGRVLSIDLGVHLFATQLQAESDSFGPDYDKDAPWTGAADTSWYNDTDTEFTLVTAEQLAGLAQIVNSGKDTFAGKTVKLAANVDLNNAPWTPIGAGSNRFEGSFIGTGYTISNLYVVGEKALGLFGKTFTGAHIEGVTINNAYVSGNDYVGAVLGQGYLGHNCIVNCTVTNATIIATPYQLDDGTYDGGAKAGVIAGQAYNGNITGCTVKNSTVTAYRDLGGIAGMLDFDGKAGTTVEASGNTVDTVTLTYLDLEGAAYDGGKANQNMGDVVGRVGTNATVGENTVSNVTRTTDITYMIDGVWYRKNVDANTVKLFAITEKFTGETLTVPAGVTALGSKLLNGNTTIKEVVIPAGLTDFGGTPNATGTGASGGFFYYSAVEKVTLPEGLTEIPAAAFNGATNLKEVNIPATVTTIGINAFAYTGLTELTVPATVTSIGYGAFRGMENLTTVTIEGESVYIPDYAFRACPKLTTVILNADSLTLQTGNMAFTNTSTNNENPNNITIYVKNEDVYNTLVNNKNIKCKVVVATIPDSGATVGEKAQSVAEALADGGYVVLTESLMFSSDDTTANSGYGATGVSVKGGTLDGNGNSLGINNWGTWDAAVHTTGGTIKNLTVNSGMRGIFMGSATADVFIDNVIIDGTIYTFNSDGGSKEYGVYISNSTLNGWTSHSDVHKEVVYTNCNFGEGSGYAFCRPYGKTVFKNCVFEEGFEFDTSNTSAITFENCYYGDTLITAANAATLGNGETTFFYNGLNGITINGTKATNASTSEGLNSALTSSSDVAVTLAAGNYTLPSVNNGDVTISGTEDTVITVNKPNYSGSDVTFNGVTVKGSGYATGVQHVNTVTYNSATIVGEMCLYGEKVVFNNCTFELNGQYIWTYGAKEVEFINCTFNTTGKAILIYNEGAGASKVTVKGCTFNATAGAKAGAIANQNCAAIEIDNFQSSGTGAAHVLITEGNTYSDNFSGEWRIKSFTAGNAVTVNGTEYTQIAIDGKLMTIDGSKNVTVLN